MALRFMQIFIPDDDGSRLESVLEGREVLGTWRDVQGKNRQVVHLLVPAEETEPIMDKLGEAYPNPEDLRVVLLGIEAVLPRPEETNGDPAAADDAEPGVEEAATKNGRVSREELYEDVTQGLGVNRIFLAMTVLSAFVAGLGLLGDDVAVIIGAMVIAPLLGPNVAMSLATTLGDLSLLKRALWTNVIGSSLAFAVAVLMGIAFAVDPKIPAIAARTQLSLTDLALALAAGSAGTFAVTSGKSNAVIGVMVAVALMPPLVAFGMLLGDGRFVPARGAMLILLANVVCINLAGVGTF